MSLPKSIVDVLDGHTKIIEEKIVSTLSLTRQEKLQSAMLYLIESGGKRLRACLPFLVGKMIGNTSNSHYDVGAAIEIIHNFTLIHDDIMDDDSMRRGRKSVHEAFNVPTAINAGDAMLAVAFELISSSEDIDVEILPEIVQIIGQMVRRVSEGQQLDIDNENRRNITIDDYLYMIEGKTAVMFEACAKSGAILSGASKEEVEQLGKWGLNLGLCFQIVDDLIDIISEENISGKPLGSDLMQGKMTCIVIHAMDNNDEKALLNIENVLGKKDEVTDNQLGLAIESLKELGSIDYCRDLAHEYHQKSKKCLEGFKQNKAFKSLMDLTDYHINRIK